MTQLSVEIAPPLVAALLLISVEQAEQSFQMDNHHNDKIFCVRYKLQNKFEVSYICEAEANWPIITALLEDEKYDDEQCC